MKNPWTQFLKMIIAGLMILISCKQVEETTATKTIDNFARNTESVSFKLNECKKDQDSFFYQSNAVASESDVEQWLSSEGAIEGSESLINDVKQDLKEVLMLVPKGAGEIFFNKGFKIFLFNSAPDNCSAQSVAIDENHSQKPLACLHDEGISLGAGQLQVNSKTAMTLSLKQVIRHYLLRAMLYHNAAFLSNVQKQISTIGAEGSLENNLKLYEQHKEDLVAAFLVDLGANKLGDPNQFVSRRTDELFQQALLVEAYDSSLCSQKTHGIFMTCFPNMYNVMYRFPALVDAGRVNAAACAQARLAAQ